MPSYYEVLGVKVDASQEEIREKYRVLVNLYHPDKHANNPLRELAEQKMKEINEAYEVLSDQDSRRQYDSGGFGDSSQSGYSSSVSYDSLIAQATNAFSQRLWSKTVEYCSQAISLNSGRYEAYAIRGMALSNQNSHSRAVSDFEKAVSSGGHEDWIYASLAHSEAELGNHREAIRRIKEAMTVGRREPNYLAFLAVQYEAVGDKYLATAIWDELREKDPNNETLRQRDQVWRVGGTYVDKKDVGTAAAACACCFLTDLLCNCC